MRAKKARKCGLWHVSVRRFSEIAKDERIAGGRTNATGDMSTRSPFFQKIKIKTGNGLDQLEKEVIGTVRRQQGRIDDAWGLQAARQEKRCLMKSR